MELFAAIFCFLVAGLCFTLVFVNIKRYGSLSRWMQTNRSKQNELLAQKRDAQLNASQWLRILNDCGKIFKSTYEPEIFFSRYDLMIETTTNLANAQKYITLNIDMSPNDLLREANAQKENETSEFIRRSYRRLLKDIEELKTIKGKTNRIDIYFAQFFSYSEKMFASNLSLLEDLRSECDRIIAGWTQSTSMWGDVMAKRIRGTNTGIPGLSFSWKRALGVTKAKRKIARVTGIPTTRSGRQRKVGKAMGCLLPILIFAVCLASLLTLLIWSDPMPKKRRSERMPSADNLTSYEPSFAIFCRKWRVDDE